MRRRVAVSFLALLWSGLLGAQPLTIYTEIAPPNQFEDAAGNLTGYYVELVRELQKRVPNHDPIQVVPWVKGYKEAQSRPNVLLFSMVRSAERDPLFQWVGPAAESRFLFYVKADSKLVIRSLEDAKKLERIGVYREDIRDQYLTQAGFTNLDRSIDTEIMVKKLMAGRIDALVNAAEGIDQIVESAGFQPREVKGIFSFMRVQTYLAFSLGTPSGTVKAWRQALEAMKKDGSFEGLFRKYYPTHPLPGPASKPF